MLCLLLLPVIAATVPLGKTCTSPDTGCDIPVRDETVLLQMEANVLRHRSLSNVGSIASSPKYSLFSKGNEPGEMEISLNCPGQHGPVFFHLKDPIRSGDSGVLYHLHEDGGHLAKFSRSLEGAGDPFDEEVKLAGLFPSFTPRTRKCTAIVQKYESLAENTAENNMITVTGGHRDFTFPVLMKDLIQGTGLENVLMTLCSPEKTTGLGKLSQPQTCPLDTRTSKFSRAKYNAVKALVPGDHRRVSLSTSLRQQINCIMGTFADHCKDKGEAVTDLKPQNWHYGKRNGQGAAKLFVVDAAIVKNVQEHACPPAIVGDSFFPTGQPVSHMGDTCLGPHWTSWETPDDVQDMVDLKQQCVAPKPGAKPGPATGSSVADEIKTEG